MGVHSCGNQKTPSGSQFSPSTILGPGSNSDSQAWQQVPSPTEPSQQSVLISLYTLEVYNHWQVPVWLKDSHSHLLLWEQHGEEAFRVGLVRTPRQTAWLHRFKSTLVLCPMGPAITSEAAKATAFFKSLEDTYHRHVLITKSVVFFFYFVAATNCGIQFCDISGTVYSWAFSCF